MTTTASASPMKMADLSPKAASYPNSNTSPYIGPSASQSVASTSSVTLDEPNTGYSASNTATPGPIIQTTADLGPTLKEEDEDAKLLASLAEDISKGIQDTASLVGLDDTAISSIKAETFNALPIDNDADKTFSGAIEDASGPIQAYAKLEFPGFSYYIQTLDCTIGRRPAHMRTPAQQDDETQHITGAKKIEGDVDVDLGLLKSISRLHVRIFYQDQPRRNSLFADMSDGYYDPESGQGGSQGRFVLQVLGRNGCFVDDVPVEKDAIVPLGKRTKIQIAERVFYFVLPPAPPKKTYNSDGELGSGESLDESEEESGSLGSSEDEEEDDSSASSSSSEEESEEVQDSDSENDGDKKKRPKLVLKKKAVPPAMTGKGKGKQQGKAIWAGKGLQSNKRKNEEDEEEEEEEEESEDEVEEVEVKKASGKGSSKKAKASTATKAKVGPVDGESLGRKRKRGSGVDQEKASALKVGTPIGVETLNLKSKKKKKVNGESAEDQSASLPLTTPVKGKGKGGGKAHIVAAALAAKAKADEEKTKGQTSPSSNSKSTVPSTNAAGASLSTAIRSSNTTPARSSNQAPGLSTGASPRPLDMSRPLQSHVRPAGSGPSVPGSYQSSTRPLQRPITGTQQSIHAGSSTAGVRPAGALGSITPAPFPPSSAAFAHLASQNRPPPAASSQPLPPAGAGIKPDLSNMDLVREALANSLSLSRGGKLTLQEIYEDISSKHEWYRNNNRTNGRDWHSSIRHAVGNSKDMVRIPKKLNEQGKGVFYAFNSSEAAKESRLEDHGNGILPVQSGSPASPTPPIITATGPAINVASTRPLSTMPSTPRPAPAPQSTAPSRPSPQIIPNSRVTIVIGKAPAEALAQMATVPKAAMTKSIETLFKGPPIVHHEGKLYLNPVVFGHMSASEVNEIGGKGAQQALALLQGQLLKHLQTVMAPKAGQAPSPRPARPPTNSATTHLQQPSRPPPQANVNARPPNTASRPLQPRPGAPVQGLVQTARPAPPLSIITPPVSGRPIPSGVPNAVRPSLNGAPRPMVRPGAAPVANRPQQQQSRPPVMVNGQAMALRPLPPAGQASRPPLVVPGGSPMTSTLPRPGSGSAPSITTAQRPLQRPPQPQSLPRPVPRPQSIPTAAAVGSAPSSSTVPSSSSGSSTASAPTPAPSSNAMMSAMQALASHPDAAYLMTLLSGGKVESGAKLTPGQLDLLQRAGRIAAEQQKAQQQKLESNPNSTSSPAAPTSQ